MKEKAFIDQQNTREPLWVNAFALVLLGAVSLGYVLFKRNFAELHFQLPFFGGLPLFPGEMLWMACFILALIKLLRFENSIRYPLLVSNRMSSLWFWVVIYMVWLLLKVSFGLIFSGPLALRHAALFYYPLFFIFGFLFFDPRFFSRKILLALSGIIIVIFARDMHDWYWTLTLSSLAVILILRLRSLPIRLLMAALLFLFIPYLAFFFTARMMIVANTFSFVILGAGVWRVLFFKKIHKVFILVFFIGAIGAAAYYSFFIKSPFRVFVGPNLVIKQYQLIDQKIQDRKKYYNYVPVSIPAQLYRPEGASLPCVSSSKKEMKLLREVDKKIAASRANLAAQHELAPLDVGAGVKQVSINNIIFRFFIWRDMWREWCRKKPFFGFNLGHPLRSESLEIAGWGDNEWGVLGWIEPHNSYFHILYRAGVLGIIFVSGILGLAIWLLVNAFAMRSLTAILLSAIVWNWMIAANFLITFEMPYTAIPFWTLFGMSIAYCKQLKDASISGA